jgi:flagellar assembly factor FliW
LVWIKEVIMEINTRDFGVININEDSVYSFPQGVYGFEDVDSFAVFMNEEAGVSFVYLQAVKSPNPCFLVFSPWDMARGYRPEVSEDDLSLLGVESEKDLIFLTIATVPPKDVRQLSINVKSPIVLNPLNMVGRQVILLNEDYPVRYKPFLDVSLSDPAAEPAAAPLKPPGATPFPKPPRPSSGKGV